jgi:hypothetical protein
MTYPEKITNEISAYRKAGFILMNLLTNCRFKDNIVDPHRVPDILVNESMALSGILEDELTDDIIKCLRAGPLTEKYYCWTKCINYDSGISSDDLWEISKLCYKGKNGTGNFETHIKVLEEETEKLLKVHWPFIIQVARRILTREEMTNGEIAGLWQHFNHN